MHETCGECNHPVELCGAVIYPAAIDITITCNGASALCARFSIVSGYALWRSEQDCDEDKKRFFWWIMVNAGVDLSLAVIYVTGGSVILTKDDEWCPIPGALIHVFEELSLCFTVAMTYTCYRQLSQDLSVEERMSLLTKLKSSVVGARRRTLLSISLLWAVCSAVILASLDGFGLSFAWCAIEFDNACLTIGMRLGLLYGPVLLVFGALLYMYFTLTWQIGIVDDDHKAWEETVYNLFKIYVWVFVAAWFFPTLHRFIELWPCLPCGWRRFF